MPGPASKRYALAGHISPVAVENKEFADAVLLQTGNYVVQHRGKGLRSQGNGAGETHVMVGYAEGERGRQYSAREEAAGQVPCSRRGQGYV